MGLPRRLLLSSTFWEVSRPRNPLTPGHLAIVLTDPSKTFDAGSAADLLRCYRAARTALSAVLNSHTFRLQFSMNWHPVGSGVGEPLAESSTPTFHLFGDTGPGAALAQPELLQWPTAEQQLALPAHRRRVLRETEREDLDLALRTEIRSADAQAQGALPQTSLPQGAGTATVSVISLGDESGASCGLKVTFGVVPSTAGAGEIGALAPELVVDLAGKLTAQIEASPYPGVSCLALDGPQAVMYVYPRSVTEKTNPLLPPT
ncbi:hypothetical protein ACQR35_01650 [Pseudarthrobacter sp. J1738]|uniref:hypothetical protein n=1 Tax=unclassified Pseudarthrobacter TaxID=2647000 RepID=UPI003D2B304C